MDEASVRAAAVRVACGYVGGPVTGLKAAPDPVSRMHEALNVAESDICSISAAEADGHVVQGTAEMVRAELDQALAPAAARVAAILRETGRILASANAKRLRRGIGA